MTSRDSLTGLFNRRAFDDLVKPIHLLARRSGRPYCVIAIDMDGLKRINDSEGHAAGDQAILARARRLQACKRSSDILARYGGEEFVMLLPETDALGGRNMMERLITAVKDDQLSISVGVTTFPEHGDSLEALLERADSAMYVSKSSGVNRVSAEAVACAESRGRPEVL